MDKVRISDHVSVYKDDNGFYFENDRGMNVNGNRTIHMANWKLKDLKDMVKFLEEN